jgi:hypothetical protein
MIVPILEALGLVGPQLASVISALALSLSIIKTWRTIRAAFAGR